MALSESKVLVSDIDLSVNFIFDNDAEARYVRREGTDYAIVYLSSHSGCNQACRFCHLTQTGQTNLAPVSIQDTYEQMARVLKHYKQRIDSGAESPVNKIHYNWMARGDVMLNEYICRNWNEVAKLGRQAALAVGVEEVVFNFSTIMPKEGLNNFISLNEEVQSLENKVDAPIIFYSLYSSDEIFRARWIPKALAVGFALPLLKTYQKNTSNPLVLHWAFIKDENDSEESVQTICELITLLRIDARFNLVRYNPYGEKQGVESSEEVIHSRFNQILPYMTVPGSRIVPRVGRDVFASCGTFPDLTHI